MRWRRFPRLQGPVLAGVAAGVAAIAILGGAVISGLVPGAGRAQSDAAPTAAEAEAGDTAGNVPGQLQEKAEAGPGGNQGFAFTAAGEAPQDATAGAAADNPEGSAAGRTFAARDLPAGPGSAHAYAFDAASGASVAALRRAAGAFGLSGEVSGDIMGVLTMADGAATASVIQGGEAEFSYDSGSGEDLAQPGQSPGAAPAPGEVEARGEAQRALAAMGLDAGQFGFSYAAPGQGIATVTAQRRVAGTAIGSPWTFTLTATGITKAEGPLAPVRDLGPYPVLSPAQAVARLGDPAFAGAGLVPFGTDTVVPGAPGFLWGAPGGEDQGTAPPALPSPGAALTWPVNSVTISRAYLQLAPVTQPGGALAALPVWVLMSPEGESWTVLALASSAIAGR